MKHTTTNQFAVQTKNGEVIKVGRSVIYQPKASLNGQDRIKWFDDSVLLKKQHLQNK